MLFLLAWLLWHNDEENAENAFLQPEEIIKEENLKVIDLTDDKPVQADTKRTQVIEDDIIVSDVNLDENENPFFDLDFDENPETNNDVTSDETKEHKPTVSIHQKSKYVTNSKKPVVSVSVSPGTKFTVKSKTPSGRIHSIVMKKQDGGNKKDQITRKEHSVGRNVNILNAVDQIDSTEEHASESPSNFRSQTPSICIKPESSVHFDHGGVCLPKDKEHHLKAHNYERSPK